jgi:hypothetical protein
MKSFCNFCKNFYLLILFIIKQKDCKEEIISTSFIFLMGISGLFSVVKSETDTILSSVNI